jgi:hypothetical protein
MLNSVYDLYPLVDTLYGLLCDNTAVDFQCFIMKGFCGIVAFQQSLENLRKLYSSFLPSS